MTVRWNGLALVLGMALGPVGFAAASTVEELQGHVWMLKCENGFAEAVDAARELLDLQIANNAPQYDVAYARVQLALVERIAGLSPEAQSELAYAYSLNGAISAAHYEADYAEGLRLCREQYDVYVKHLGPGNLDAVYILGGTAFFAEMLGDYGGAMAMYEDCLAGLRALLGDGHPQVAMHLNNLAALHANLGNLGIAESLMEEALNLRVASMGAGHPHVGQSLNNLAIINKRKGDNLKAESLYRRALTIYRETRGPDSKSVARLLNNMGVLLYEQKDYTEAEKKLEEALAIRESALGPDHVDVAVSLMNVARLRSDQGAYDEAEDLCRRALAIRRETFGDPHPKIADTFAEMAVMATDQGRIDEAEGLLREALQIWESFWGAGHPKLAEGLAELARVQDQAGLKYDAVESYQRCLDILSRQPVEILPREVDTRVHLAGLLQELGRYGEARDHLELAATKYEMARVRAGSALLRDWVMRSPYPRLAAARLMEFETGGAWEAHEAGLSRKLSDLVFDLELRPLSQQRKLEQAELLRAMERAQEKLEALEPYRTGSEGQRGEYEGVREELIQAESRWISLQEDLAREQSLAEGRPASLASVQRCLAEDTALIGWLDVAMAGDESYSAGYVVRSRGDVTWVSLPGTRREVERFRDKLAVAGAWPFRLDADEALELSAHALWESRFAPLLESLHDIRNLVVIPSGAMRGIPLEVLRDDAGRTVGETYTVSYTPSATLYRWLKNKPARQDLPEPALLVGDPVFQAGEEDDGEVFPEALVFRSALAGNRRALSDLPSLPGSRREVETISGIFDRCVTLTGPEATESRLMQMAADGELRGFRVLHLATHALLDPEQPARSALVLSRGALPDPVEQALKGEPIDDGLLTVREILADCQMNADLVTLSACRTAATGPGVDRDYLGLAPAFLYAGAHNLLVSLWPVDDEATLKLMTRFYRNLAGGDRPLSMSESLAEAKQWLRAYQDEEGARPFAHPVYWGGFVLVGAGE